MQKHHIFFLYKNFHMYCISRDTFYLHVNHLNITEALPFFLHRHCLICKHPFWGSLRIQGLWHKLKSWVGNVSAFLSEPPLLSLSIQNKASSKLSRYKIVKGSLFSSTSLPLGNLVKRKEQGSFSSSHQKDERDGGGEERTLFPDSKRKKKVKQGIFFLAPKKALEAWL